MALVRIKSDYFSSLKSELINILDGKNDKSTNKNNNVKMLENMIKKLVTVPKRDKTFRQKMLYFLRKCMLHHCINEAALILLSLSRQPRTIIKTLLSVGCEVLWKHPKSSLAIVEMFVNRFEKTPGLTYNDVLKLKLETYFYNLYKENIDSAKNFCKIPDIKRRRASYRPVLLESSIRGYQGLTEYITWLQNKARLTNADNASVNVSEIENTMKNHSANALHYFKLATAEKGCWDLFITKQVEILCYYDPKSSSARKVLEKFKKKNPDNPNAHLYLYLYHKRNQADNNVLITLLEKFIELIPSDYRVLELYDLYTNDSSIHITKKISLLFNALDYACWQSNLKLWEVFADLLLDISANSSPEEFQIVKTFWQPRKLWWPKYYFRINSFTENLDLASIKLKVMKLLMGHCRLLSAYKFYVTTEQWKIVKKLSCITV